MPEERLLMIIDPETREAYRGGEGPSGSGPLFFTTRDAIEEYARTRGLGNYAVHEVPAGVLGRMKGKPYWVDGVRRDA